MTKLTSSNGLITFTIKGLDNLPCVNCPNPTGCRKAGRCGGGGHKPKKVKK